MNKKSRPPTFGVMESVTSRLPRLPASFVMLDLCLCVTSWTYLCCYGYRVSMATIQFVRDVTGLFVWLRGNQMTI